ncbi:hypothetical protein PUNSTDRAFT_129405 [Punctularia strigosozonata HHB-11173 SS5]|uniref:uncharacterized protein n=1 Tax=Punctularia strigosozonata (strain HHB-11173) TaxID=741275 RepID=UPI0004417EDE|nr:uncharacterized protein PUNSTDRAFT_129405 [Punctularia strigosozonata HHB-11173 SS5]EIN13729.1 hypothetical protein PUNSTDRAFT_129405 [Punctularia strigosozonata HHB-11173 SS5]
MGSMCSKSSTHEGGHTVLGSGSDANQNSLGGSAHRREDPRAAAAAAAEARLKREQERGTHASNPNRGRLASKLEASKAAKTTPEGVPDRVIYD